MTSTVGLRYVAIIGQADHEPGVSELLERSDRPTRDTIENQPGSAGFESAVTQEFAQQVGRGATMTGADDGAVVGRVFRNRGEHVGRGLM